MANLIHRVVLFKVTDADKQTQLLKATDKLSKENSKDGKPYIAYMCAGSSDQSDARHKGYTVVLQTKFHSMADMKYFDEQCPAHQELKETYKAMKPEEPPLVAFFEGAPLIDETKA